MRRKLFQEGIEQQTGLFVEVGAVDFDPEKKYPISHPDPIFGVLGYVNELRREEEGWITGEVELNGFAKVDSDDYDLSFYCQIGKRVGVGNAVKECKLRGVTFIPNMVAKRANEESNGC